MPKREVRFAWLKSGLFWRTFFLLGFLIAASMVAWVISFRMVEREPRGHQIAAQVVSVVTVTRAALMHSAPDSRRELLFDLASNEGIRVYPREKTDKVEPPPAIPLMPVIESSVREKLGNKTAFAGSVNELPGFWVSFEMEDDAYWLMLDRERVERLSGAQWIGWATATLLLSLLGAAFISRLVNQPLARINRAARLLAKGEMPAPLPERGAAEIQQTNRSFNQMVEDLTRIESDRAIILAGISHDLRTPIARMLLEVEMASLTPEAREGMQSDLSQMDAIIGQFLTYARPISNASFARVDLSKLLGDCAHEAARLGGVEVSTEIAVGLQVMGNETELMRTISNLMENARRYGVTPQTDTVELHLAGYLKDGLAMLEISDRGPGVPEKEVDLMLRPFTRLDTARSQAEGSGLGLAIVNRIIKQHGGKLRLINRKEGGLTVQAALPLARKQPKGTQGEMGANTASTGRMV